VLLIEAENTS